MKLSPLIIFASRRRITIAPFFYLSAMLMIVGGVILAAANEIAPRVADVRPLLPVPDAIQTVANVLAYLAALGAIAILSLLLLAATERDLARKQQPAFSQLIPLSELLNNSSSITFAPNLDDAIRSEVLSRLEHLARQGDISSVLFPLTDGDIDDISTDKALITTTMKGRAFQEMTEEIHSDGASKISAKDRLAIERRAPLGQGTTWLLIWD